MRPPQWDELDSVLKMQYMMYDDAFHIYDMYFDGTRQDAKFIENSKVQKAIYDIQMRVEPYERFVDKSEHEAYGDTSVLLLNALDKYPIEGKTVLNVGNDGSCWFEAMILARGGAPTTADYNRLQSDCPDLDFITDTELAESTLQFDCAFSISSYEHSGLGRYGDPLDPDGDLKAMQELKKFVKKDGLLFLAVPIGQDCISWNAHRIYGRKRLPFLLYNWQEIDSFGVLPQFYDASQNGDVVVPQPIFVLKNI